MRPYQYRCHDYSLLTPTFKKRMVAPLLKFVPWAIPANVVTIISNLFNYLALFLALNQDVLGIYTRIVVALCFLMYLLGDHLDGMQAKRTGTGSALGEFCDHYLDAFNNGILVYTVLAIFGITNIVLVACVITASYLAHMTVFYEQFKTGWLTFEKLGSLEGVLLSAILVGIATIQPVFDLLTLKIIFNISIIEAIMISSALGAVLTFFSTFKRTPEVGAGFWLFTLSLIIVAACGVFVLTSVQLFVLLTLYASLYIGRIMRGHLVDGIERHTDFVIPVVMMALALTDQSIAYGFLIILTYLAICIAWLVVQVFSTLKIYWVWVNARPQ